MTQIEILLEQMDKSLDCKAKDVNVTKCVGFITQLMGELEEKNVEISERVFSNMNPEQRKLALMGYAVLVAQSLSEM